MSATEIRAEIFTEVPENFRVTDRRSDWADANKPGTVVPTFLEGPSFDRAGNLWVVDIPWGRVFSVNPDGQWSLKAEYDGWPNGLRVHADGSIRIADHLRGMLRLDAETGSVEDEIAHRRAESFKGCNDLFYGMDGTLYFTDQGQTGLHDPSGRVFRKRPKDGPLDCLLSNGPSPNGLVTGIDDQVLYVAMTRSAEIWRLPLFAEGTSKVGLFARLPAGNSGPDGMALDEEGNLYVCHASRGRVYAYDPHGEPYLTVDCSHIGRTVTNLAFGGDNRRDLYITVSDSSTVALARMPVPGRLMYSHF